MTELVTQSLDEFYHESVVAVVDRLNAKYARPAGSRGTTMPIEEWGFNWGRATIGWRRNGRVMMPDVAYRPGCYVVFADYEVVYVGQSDAMNVRIAAHLGKRGAAMTRALGRVVESWQVAYRPERFYGERATLELRLIRRLKPILNRTRGNGWGKSDMPPVNQNNYRRLEA